MQISVGLEVKVWARMQSFLFFFYVLFSVFIHNYFESILNLNMSFTLQPIYTSSNPNVGIYFYFLIFI
jgi:hypothetical protein